MFEVQEESQIPQGAGWLLALVVLLGVGFFVIVAVMNKTNDTLYDTDRSSYDSVITSSKVMEGNDLWTRKKPIEPDTTDNRTQPTEKSPTLKSAEPKPEAPKQPTSKPG